MKTSLKWGSVFFVLTIFLLGLEAVAIVSLKNVEAATSADAVKTATVSKNAVASTVRSTSISAEDVMPGIFGANIASDYKNYFFPAQLTIGSALIVNGGITVSRNLPSELRFLPDRGPVLRTESNILKFIDGNTYYFDNKIGVKTTNPQATLDVNGSIRAVDYYANGNRGLSASYSLKGSNGQNCSQTFTDGLLTASTCPSSAAVSAVKK